VEEEKEEEEEEEEEEVESTVDISAFLGNTTENI